MDQEYQQVCFVCNLKKYLVLLCHSKLNYLRSDQKMKNRFVEFRIKILSKCIQPILYVQNFVCRHYKRKGYGFEFWCSILSLSCNYKLFLDYFVWKYHKGIIWKPFMKQYSDQPIFSNNCQGQFFPNNATFSIVYMHHIKRERVLSWFSSERVSTIFFRNEKSFYWNNMKWC